MELDWKPMSSAPRDGIKILGRNEEETRTTWFGKTSHVPLYGWCFGHDPEDIDLWEPTEWTEINISIRR